MVSDIPPVMWDCRRMLEAPLFLWQPMSIGLPDIFADEWSDEQRHSIFAVMALTRRHSYQIPTAHPERAAEYLNGIYMPGAVCDVAVREFGRYLHKGEWKEHSGGTYRKLTPVQWPLPNVRLDQQGVSP